MSSDLDFNKNNLDKANSPYLKQHQDNPIYWQEWSKQVLDYAKDKGKLIFVSVGYATCHWCHVMAKEAFSNLEVANFLNDYFVSIKVDREQRPDIDAHFMDFLVATQGSGGWPMNVVLTPDAKPFFAGTYFPLESNFGRPGFRQILEHVLKWYQKNPLQIERFKPSSQEEPGMDERSLIEIIKVQFDKEYGGWGQGAKFPPYNTLLFLMNYLTKSNDHYLKELVTMTLDQMAKVGLHDHLQGGFFRYCVDRKWKIPHFEKMLYDQAMLLWVYSLGFQIFKDNFYKHAALGIISSLENVFVKNNLYYSATDADTNHQEGATYLWTKDELQNLLSRDEWQSFIKIYDLSDESKLGGKLHLIKKTKDQVAEIEQKLLKARNTKPQPDKDKKIITSWNALLGIAFLIAGRYLQSDSFNQRGIKLYHQLLSKHHNGSRLVHSSLDDKLQKQVFLEDYASVLLLSTYIHEETGEEKPVILKLKPKLLEYFKDGKWMESLGSEDFIPVAASSFDHPTPSSISLTEEALRRADLVLGEIDERKLKYQSPLSNDFYNLVVFYKLGNFHEIHTKEKISYTLLPVNSLQLRSDRYQDCFQMQCHDFKTQDGLAHFLYSSPLNIQPE